MNIRNRRFIFLAVISALILANMLYIAQRAGEKAAERGIARLELIWPSVLDMPEQDRALLAGLAMTCRLDSRPDATAEAVETCLREALRSSRPMLPRGMDKAKASAELERLLALSRLRAPSPATTSQSR